VELSDWSFWKICTNQLVDCDNFLDSHLNFTLNMPPKCLKCVVPLLIFVFFVYQSSSFLFTKFLETRAVFEDKCSLEEEER
jgi:hypothetical protein